MSNASKPFGSVVKKLLTRDASQTWPVMSVYERFEQLVAMSLTAIISVIIVISLVHLGARVVRFILLDADPLDYSVFQQIFGMILTVLIALEFQHSIFKVKMRRDGIVQVKTVILIAILAISRKFIIADLHTMDPLGLAAMAASIIALGGVYWLTSERVDGELRTISAMLDK